MNGTRLETLRHALRHGASWLYALLLHGLLGGLLLLKPGTHPLQSARPALPTPEPVEATAVDEALVEQELARIQTQEREARAREQQHQEQLRQQADQARSQRIAEEKKQRELKKQAELARRQRITEEKKQQELKKQAELARRQRLAEEKKQQELKKQAELARRQRLAEEKKQQELKKQAELTRRQHLAEEKKQQELKKQAELARRQRLAEEQRRKDRQLIQQMSNAIHSEVVSNFNKSGLPAGLSCKLEAVVAPDGTVLEVSVSNTSGNEIFDQRVLLAVRKSSPLPIPKDIQSFKRLGLDRIVFNFAP